MSTQVPYLSRLGIYRISIEKQETLIKLMVLSTCAILCKWPEMSTCSSQLCAFVETMVIVYSCSVFHETVCCSKIWERHSRVWSVSCPHFRLLCVASHGGVTLDLLYSYFNFRTTKYLTREGFYSFHNWFDDRAWYPLGRIIGGTIYPGNVGWFILINAHLPFAINGLWPIRC